MKNIEKIIHLISAYLNYPGIFSVGLMMLFISVDVIGRYIFNKPISGSIDIIALLMVVLVFCSIAYCASQNNNVRIDIFYLKLPQQIKSLLDIITSFLSFIFVGLLSWRLGNQAWNYIQKPPGATTLFFQWPLIPFYLLAAVGCAILCLELILWFISSILKLASRKSSEGKTTF